MKSCYALLTNSYPISLLSFSKPSEFFDYGVTMEAVETNVREGVLSLKARGRQRCQIISEIKPLSERLQTVLVKILPEYKIPTPLIDTQLYTLKRKKPYICKDYSEMKVIRKYRKWEIFDDLVGLIPTVLQFFLFYRYHTAQFRFPDWVYEGYEVCYYVKHILDGLAKCFQLEYVPKDPLVLSFWFIQNYLLQYRERLKLLQEDHVLSRLRLEVQYLKYVSRWSSWGPCLCPYYISVWCIVVCCLILYWFSQNRVMLCHNCRKKIAEQQDIIVLSKDGIQNNFVNPGEY